MALHRKVDASDEPDVDINPIYVQEAGHEVPRHTMPRRGMLPATALQVVRDELILDGNPRLNLATFVTTWMEPQAEVLMAECLGKNMIDKDEYPQTAETRVALCQHPGQPVARAHRLGGDRVLDHRLQRGLHARRDGAAVALARARRHRAAQPGDGRERAGVLGEVLPLLADRAAQGAARARPAPPDRARGRGPLR